MNKRKRYPALLSHVMLLGLLACQGPPGPVDPPEPSASAHPSVIPTSMPEPGASALPSSAPTASPEPSASPQPQPTPVHQVEVVDITPPEFLAAQSSIRALTVDDHPTDPTIYVDYAGGGGVEAGIWQFQAGKPPKLLVQEAALRSSVDDMLRLTLKYHQQSLYVLTPQTRGACFKKVSLTAQNQGDIPCLPYYSHPATPQSLAMNAAGDLFTFVMKDPSIHSAALRFLKVNAEKTEEMLVSQPIGPDKKLSTTYMEIPTLSTSPCLGICFPNPALLSYNGPAGYNSVEWEDLENGLRYKYSSRMFSAPGAHIIHYAIPDGIEPEEIPANENGFIPFIQDGPADKATFLLPFDRRFHFDVDSHQNLYVLDYLPVSFTETSNVVDFIGEHYIRKISPDGNVSTLLSARGIKGLGYPSSEVSLSDVLKNSSDETEVEPIELPPLGIQSFVIDQQHNEMYILQKYIFHYDLSSHKLTLLGVDKKELSRLYSYDVNNLSIGGDKNLYLHTTGTGDKGRILKIHLPQYLH